MRQHIRSDVLRPIIERRYPHIIDLPASFIGCAVFFLISFANWGDMVEAWSVGEWEGHGDFHLLTAPFRTILVGGAALSSLSYGIHCGGVLDLIARQKEALWTAVIGVFSPDSCCSGCGDRVDSQ
jgi:hypothetical protein